MPSFVVRVWMPDRPGALGAVASRIGAVRGDLTGIEILETGAGRAIDELVVSLPSADLVDLLLAEICQVDGVDVEDVRPVDLDPGLNMLDTAVLLVEQSDLGRLEVQIVEHAALNLAANWCALIELGGRRLLASTGSPPPAVWLAAFVAGSGSSLRVAAGESGPDDVAWARLGPELALVLGRSGRPFRASERQELAALGRIAGCRWGELAGRLARRVHPSVAL